MSNHALNVFGTNGPSANLFAPGLPLEMSLTEQTSDCEPESTHHDFTWINPDEVCAEDVLYVCDSHDDVEARLLEMYLNEDPKDDYDTASSGWTLQNEDDHARAFKMADDANDDARALKVADYADETSEIESTQLDLMPCVKTYLTWREDMFKCCRRYGRGTHDYRRSPRQLYKLALRKDRS